MSDERIPFNDAWAEVRWPVFEPVRGRKGDPFILIKLVKLDILVQADAPQTNPFTLEY